MTKKVQTVAPKRDFEILDKPGGFEILVKSHSPFRMYVLMMLGAGPIALGIVVFLIALVAYIGESGGSGKVTAMMVALVMIVVGAAMMRLATIKNTTRIAFDDEGVVIKNRRYAYENIEQIGYDSASNDLPDVMPDNAFNSTMVNIQGAFGYYVYIQYGSERIVLVKGLTRDNIDGIFRRIHAKLGAKDVRLASLA